ncbi:SDR family NAD(P)-dependent oxidoreductase [Kibdelosporangium phytohabitans]|uniref:3-oxoacyl-ACP reductase n=1 Tax=Kibdelosporangium phytohabitans TaxID=860235 RepID=A0A0N9HZP0_9PSEU|nr:SDR family oxidoreductase [Kibdelosporangium phytohabitans]ALG10787.1 3-oxoacyl-ACP reductase [Kibdelosporangium phytohabitans]MBE1461947.1 NAD(P)-dependent dehydrogenase (short-subunit alcohol dehydrogenase family) [Kibdelosporangium phytohabitans]
MEPTHGRFTGRVALVTGAGTGIGAAVCRRIVAEGGNVVLTGRRPQPLHDLATELGARALALPGDAAVTGDAQRIIKSTVEQFGRLDVVVANAGGHHPGAAADTDDDAWSYSLHANLNSAFVTIREALPSLIEAGGNVVVVSSIAGLFAGPGVVGYVTTKHALIGLMRSLARDYGHQGVRVNAVCPGWVRTAMADEQMDELGKQYGIDREAAYSLVTKNQPLRRPAESEEIANLVAFLASPEASAMTGSVVVADCGANCVDLPTIAFAEGAAQ